MTRNILLCILALALVGLVLRVVARSTLWLAQPPHSIARPPENIDLPHLPFPGESRGLDDAQALRIDNQLQVLWARGAAILKGRKDGQLIWSQTLDFAVADVRLTSDALALVTSTDGLHTVIIVPQTGEMNSAIKPRTTTDKPGAENLIKQVKTTYARALKLHRNKKDTEALAVCEQLAKLAGELAQAGLQDKSFKVWAATRKLRKAINPGAAMLPVVKEEELEDQIF